LRPPSVKLKGNARDCAGSAGCNRRLKSISDPASVVVLVFGLLRRLFLRSGPVFVSVLVRLVGCMGMRVVRMSVLVLMLMGVNQVAVTMLVSMCVGVLMHVRLD
jgi:hypothetical protein